MELTCTALAGSYPVTEADPGPAFALSQLDCNDDNSAHPSTTDLATRTATYELEVGEEVFCLFTNRFRGARSGSPRTRRAAARRRPSTSGPCRRGSTAAASRHSRRRAAQVELTCTALAGSYPVTEADPGPAFALSQLDCNDDNSARRAPPTSATRTATYELEVGEEVFCLFTNRFQGGTISDRQEHDGRRPAGDLRLRAPAGGARLRRPVDTHDARARKLELTCTALAGSYPVTRGRPGPGLRPQPARLQRRQQRPPEHHRPGHPHRDLRARGRGGGLLPVHQPLPGGHDQDRQEHDGRRPAGDLRLRAPAGGARLRRPVDTHDGGPASGADLHRARRQLPGDRGRPGPGLRPQPARLQRRQQRPPEHHRPGHPHRDLRARGRGGGLLPVHQPLPGGHDRHPEAN